jgi:cytoskeleton protein RodZ
MSEDPQALGQRLKAERERRGMSTQKIANGMHLDEWVIDALEAGDYQRIGPSVYVKGHLKKYASLLGVSSEAPASDARLSAAPAPGAYPPPIIRLDAPNEGHAAWPRIGTVAAAAILAGGLFWWREAHHGTSAPVLPAPPPTQADVSSGTAAEDAAAPAGESADSADDSAAPAMTAGAAASPRMAPAAAVPAALTKAVSAPAATAAPAAAAAAGPIAPSAAELTPGVGKARMRLSFSADSWVDIRDYSGKRVFEGNGRANSVKTVTGMAPFRVYLRSASGVQLQLNERAVAIGRQFISGDEARFEAGADGVLRREPPAAPGDGPQTAAVSPHG